MFYAAVEIRDRPELAQLPVAVGGIGMISTANYVARAWGVRSAMPGFVGQALCRRGAEFGMPRAELTFVPPNFAKYAAVADVARAIFREYDAHMRSFSLDEAFLDLTRYVRSRALLGSHDAARRALSVCGPTEPHVGPGAAEEVRGDGRGEDSPRAGCASPSAACASRVELLELAEAVVAELRARVRDATGGLTCSAGLAPNFFLAKVAADQRKPDGQFCVPASRDAIFAFLRPLPTRKVGGIGRVCEKLLKSALGVGTCGELLSSCVRGDVRLAFSPIAADSLLRAALGCTAPVDPEGAPPTAGPERPSQKGISVERTFGATANVRELLARLDELCGKLAEEMALCCGGVGVRGRTVTLKLKSDAFDVSTRDSTGAPACSANELRARARALFAREAGRAAERGQPLRIRLLGVRVTRLERADADEVGLGDGQHSIARFLCGAVRAPRAAARTVREPGDGDGDGSSASSSAESSDESGACIRRPTSRIASPCAEARAPDGARARPHAAACAVAEDARATCGAQRAPSPSSPGLRARERSPIAHALPPLARKREGPCAGEAPARRYARLARAEIDPAVLTALPEQVRRQVSAELAAAERLALEREKRAGVRAPDCAAMPAHTPAAADHGAPARVSGAECARRDMAARARSIERFLMQPREPRPGGVQSIAVGHRTRDSDGIAAAPEEQLVELVAMGFSEAEAIAALCAGRGDVHAAVECLLRSR